MISQRHIGIVVFNLDVVEKFWIEVMGYSRLNKQIEEGSFIDGLLKIQGVEVTTVKMTGQDGGIIELLKFHSHSSSHVWGGEVNSTGITHIAYTVLDIVGFYEKNHNNGLNFLNQPILSADGKVMAAYARGPERIFFEFVQVL